MTTRTTSLSARARSRPTLSAAASRMVARTLSSLPRTASSAAMLTEPRFLPLTWTTTSMHSSPGPAASCTTGSGSGHGAVRTDSRCPRPSQSSSARCGAIGASITASRSMAASRVALGAAPSAAVFPTTVESFISAATAVLNALLFSNARVTASSASLVASTTPAAATAAAPSTAAFSGSAVTVDGSSASRRIQRACPWIPASSQSSTLSGGALKSMNSRSTSAHAPPPTAPDRRHCTCSWTSSRGSPPTARQLLDNTPARRRPQQLHEVQGTCLIPAPGTWARGPCPGRGAWKTARGPRRGRGQPGSGSQTGRRASEG
ncbi:uncharacterized protein AMSG_11620 [Thecamonas trahens ATCC 50062]|uniref:Uncharacterized protein n=1 Tax=Thecamonas trahens ATCC 50062 TaxID=461836 RepID=A0A0L0DEA4_THETB|nr:hypothetical protein AMSG_11620 [Thecamonas trahens ATCC 50062]KNC50652.1 hypothetical protein AMSG_11620 [Thecamonas trahens ATCC 50062]|eukprot:XP_013762599.1 hypothetical protein AMSG_11620 [Thecamonas trahens ATCC 50062]